MKPTDCTIGSANQAGEAPKGRIRLPISSRSLTVGELLRGRRDYGASGLRSIRPAAHFAVTPRRPIG
jgi:hypothetical protein